MNERTNRRSFLKQVTTAGALTPLTTAFAWNATPASESSGLRFAVVSDGHFGQPETDYLRFHREMIAWLNQEYSMKGLDFVVLNGDLIHNEPKYLPELKALLRQLEMPFFSVKGNHDMVSAATWKGTWGYEENHTFTERDCAFLLGTTSNEKGDYLCADVDWLRSSLAAAKDRKAVFLFLHINQNGMTKHGVSCPEVAAAVKESGKVAAVFHGHDHDQDNVIYEDKLGYFFDGHMGGSWGTNYRGYRIVEMDAEGRLGTYQCNPSAFYVNYAGIRLPGTSP